MAHRRLILVRSVRRSTIPPLNVSRYRAPHAGEVWDAPISGQLSHQPPSEATTASNAPTSPAPTISNRSVVSASLPSSFRQSDLNKKRPPGYSQGGQGR